MRKNRTSSGKIREGHRDKKKNQRYPDNVENICSGCKTIIKHPTRANMYKHKCTIGGNKNAIRHDEGTIATN